MITRWLRDTRMGYIAGQAGIMRRMLREEGGWQNHLAKTSDYILQAVEDQHPKSIRILGSGWLLDVPMKHLIEHCDKIVLSDISHPNQILNKYSKYKNIEFEIIDITGGVVELSYSQKKKYFDFDTFIQQIESTQSIQFTEDLIVSLNILSQLSIVLTDYLSKKFDLTSIQAARIAESIQKIHLEMLPKGKCLLITDYEEEYYDEDDKFIGSKPSVYTTLPIGGARKEWTWDFDTKMMYKEDCKTNLRVTAVRL